MGQGQSRPERREAEGNARIRVRSPALKNGLKLEQQLGVNPYKFGMIGSTDAHTGLAAMEEDNFFGKTTRRSRARSAAPHLHEEPEDRRQIMDWEVSASGYAAVWARENTRESFWDAMQRRETYATTGPRMVVRFFGGWDFEAKDAQTVSRAGRVPKGVPMGGDLPQAPAGKAPTFLVAALKDPIGANLDRIQIVKGWLDAKGELHEKIYDVAWSGGRKPGARRQGAVGRQHGGRRERDLDEHDRRLRADRGLERPGLRSSAARLLLRARDRDPYSALDRVRREALRHEAAAGTRMTMTERAYTSPIWYTPGR